MFDPLDRDEMGRAHPSLINCFRLLTGERQISRLTDPAKAASAVMQAFEGRATLEVIETALLMRAASEGKESLHADRDATGAPLRTKRNVMVLIARNPQMWTDGYLIEQLFAELRATTH